VKQEIDPHELHYRFVRFKERYNAELYSPEEFEDLIRRLCDSLGYHGVLLIICGRILKKALKDAIYFDKCELHANLTQIRQWKKSKHT
jgi:hypothetical protein